MRSSSTVNLKSTQHGHTVISVADHAVTNDPTATLVTYALGSCIGVTIYDPIAHVGGMIHFMLPKCIARAKRVDTPPAMFGDIGIPLLFKECYALGAKKERLVVCAAGGAEVLNDNGVFKVGSRNRTLIRKIFWKNGILLSAEETGGTIARTMSLKMSDGSVEIKSNGKGTVIWPL